ncbi:MAG: hypothetical protein AABX89_05400 [Candidatus Thermoplasmatota archaeon]
MVGGYENEDQQADLEELRRKKEAQMRAWMEELRKEQAAKKAKNSKLDT